jgi:hypothetical protein
LATTAAAALALDFFGFEILGINQNQIGFGWTGWDFNCLAAFTVANAVTHWTAGARKGSKWINQPGVQGIRTSIRQRHFRSQFPRIMAHRDLDVKPDFPKFCVSSVPVLCLN